MAERDRGEALTRPDSGSETHNTESIEDSMDAKLEIFEKMVDKNDPEQMKMLEDMREHTRRLHQIRGDWNRPSSFRNWNDPVPKNMPSKKPLSVESYRYILFEFACCWTGILISGTRLPFLLEEQVCFQTQNLLISLL